MVNGDPADEPLVNGNDGLDQAQEAPLPDRGQPLNINANNARLLNLAETFADRVDEGAILHSDAVQDGSQNVSHHFNMVLNNGEDVNHYLTYMKNTLLHVKMMIRRSVEEKVPKFIG